MKWRSADPGRPLTDGEQAIVREVFGDAVNCAVVRLHHRCWWPFQSRRVVMAPNGHIWFHPESRMWRGDFAEADIGAQELFVHEMVHVWQHQSGICLPLARLPFARYTYRLVPGRPFGRYGLEQQAEIVCHAWLARQGLRENGEELAALVPFDGWA